MMISMSENHIIIIIKRFWHVIKVVGNLKLADYRLSDSF